MKKLLLKGINIYRNVWSLNRIRRCRFFPSCSEYSREAIQNTGVVKGVLLTIWRVLRCHPFSVGGYDPPPER